MPDLPLEGPLRREAGSVGGECTRLDVRVKSVDLQQGSNGEGSTLANTDAEEQRHRYRCGLDTRVVCAVTNECSEDSGEFSCS